MCSTSSSISHPDALFSGVHDEAHEHGASQMDHISSKKVRWTIDANGYGAAPRDTLRAH